MLKYIIYIGITLASIAILIALVYTGRVYLQNKKEMESYTKTQVNKKFGKVLVVYYSLSGKTKDIAERIKAKTNADIYEIKTQDELSPSILKHLEVRQQLKDKKYPKLKGELPDIASYDIIFVGAPVWWYTIATPVLSFLEIADFNGKKVIPFSTQASNAGTFMDDFKLNAKNAIILKGEKFNNMSEKYDEALEYKIASWLNNLDV